MKYDPVRECYVYAERMSINESEQSGLGKTLRSESTKQHIRNPEGLAFLA